MFVDMYSLFELRCDNEYVKLVPDENMNLTFSLLLQLVIIKIFDESSFLVSIYYYSEEFYEIQNFFIFL